MLDNHVRFNKYSINLDKVLYVILDYPSVTFIFADGNKLVLSDSAADEARRWFDSRQGRTR